MKRESEQIIIEWLVLSAQGGDRAAFETLVQRLYDKLRRYAERQLGDSELALEALHNSLEVLSRDLRKLKDPAAFLSWIYRVLHLKGIDLIRTRQRQRQYFHDDAQTENVHETAHDTIAELEFEQVLSRLTQAEYQLVHLYYLEGLSVVEIAEVLAIPDGTVKSRLFSLRQILRDKLGASYER
jgi:RNA polymerase sigma factor (sigma-70 family)